MIRSLADVEKEAILEAILSTGSIRKAAKALGITHPTIYSKLKKYGIILKAKQILCALRQQKRLTFLSRNE
jgi:molybdenum-dependent DNA-binding transcriptional regulator ModE